MGKTLEEIIEGDVLGFGRRLDQKESLACLRKWAKKVDARLAMLELCPMCGNSGSIPVSEEVSQTCPRCIGIGRGE